MRSVYYFNVNVAEAYFRKRFGRKDEVGVRSRISMINVRYLYTKSKLLLKVDSAKATYTQLLSIPTGHPYFSFTYLVSTPEPLSGGGMLVSLSAKLQLLR